MVLLFRYCYHLFDNVEGSLIVDIGGAYTEDLSAGLYHADTYYNDAWVLQLGSQTTTVMINSISK